MWEQYEPPEAAPGRPPEPSPGAPLRAAGQHGGVGVALALVGFLAVVAIGVAMAGAQDPVTDDATILCPESSTGEDVCAETGLLDDEDSFIDDEDAFLRDTEDQGW